MFDAFVRFANGIISHEAAPRGGGGGGHSGSRPRGDPRDPPPEAEPQDDLHMASDSLSLSPAFWRAQFDAEEVSDRPYAP